MEQLITVELKISRGVWVQKVNEKTMQQKPKRNRLSTAIIRPRGSSELLNCLNIPTEDALNGLNLKTLEKINHKFTECHLCSVQLRAPHFWKVLPSEQGLLGINTLFIQA